MFQKSNLNGVQLVLQHCSQLNTNFQRLSFYFQVTTSFYSNHVGQWTLSSQSTLLHTHFFFLPITLSPVRVLMMLSKWQECDEPQPFKCCRQRQCSVLVCSETSPLAASISGHCPTCFSQKTSHVCDFQDHSLERFLL